MQREYEAGNNRIKVGVVGVGKMGLSHLAIIRALDGVEVVGMVDANDYVLDVLTKYTGMPGFSSLTELLSQTRPDAILIATPSGSHSALVREALEGGAHVFCEKPLTLDAHESQELAALAAERQRIAQVGYHNRFVASFRRVKQLLDDGAIGTVTHIHAEAYGPVVLAPKGSTWRTRRDTGGGCLYDYAAHPLNLLTWYLGEPTNVRGTVLNSIFSRTTDDEVYSTFDYADGVSAQLSVNWSDESFRKMTTMVTATGTGGRIEADRQECRVYLRGDQPAIDGLRKGWNVAYTTELTEPVSFYLRGEEYSAQLESFVQAVREGRTSASENGFLSAAATDALIDRMIADAGAQSQNAPDRRQPTAPRARRRTLNLWRRS